ncbi:DUF6082 family protein [Streptomyces sp. NPDC087658]|uniref:DUF6082 family protein n=1 Tax=Streptomyces sp. NPDC087658 TaxID=3365800 RepID=UPI0038170BD9
MTTTRFLTAAVLSVGVVGAARVVLEYRHHQDRMRLRAMDMHHRMLTEESSPELAELYPFLAGLTEAERIRFLHCNKRVTFWHFQFWSGLMTQDTLTRAARGFMTSPHAREYWRCAGIVQISGARCKRGHQFVNVMEDAFHEALRDLAEPGDLVGAGA